MRVMRRLPFQAHLTHTHTYTRNTHTRNTYTQETHIHKYHMVSRDRDQDYHQFSFHCENGNHSNVWRPHTVSLKFSCVEGVTCLDLIVFFRRDSLQWSLWLYFQCLLSYLSKAPLVFLLGLWLPGLCSFTLCTILGWMWGRKDYSPAFKAIFWLRFLVSLAA